MRTYIYPGTFDPITKGHQDIIHRAINTCDKLIIGVFTSHNKNCMFSLKHRISMLELALDNVKYTDIQIEPFNTLLVDLALKHNASHIIRGIRNANDFEYEQNLFQVNRTLYNDFETLFLMAKNENKHISSSVARELITLNGDYSAFVDKKVIDFISSTK